MNHIKKALFCLTALSTIYAAACTGASDSDDNQTDEIRTKPASAAANPFDVSDVSFLFPLPKRSETPNNLISLSDKGAFGEVLSAELFSQAMGLIKGHQASPYATWKIVSFRFDPCGKESLSSPDCHTTMRLVAQPIGKGDKSGYTSFDHTMHLIFTIPSADAATVVKELSELKKSSPKTTNGLPLGIHPGFASGLTGEFAKQLKTLILNHTGSQKLSRITVMLTNSSDKWPFAAADVVEGKLNQLTMPATNSTVVSFDVTSPVPTLKTATITPEPVVEDNIDELLNINKVKALTPAELQQDIDAALRIDNPLKHDTLSTDCVSCHLASRTLLDLKERGITFDDKNANVYVPPAGITGKVKSQIGTEDYVVKAFAYHLDKTVVIQRTVNESAVVADYINKNLLE